MKRIVFSVVVVVLLISLAACAAGPNPNEIPRRENREAEVAGFWKGLWHGIISPVAFVISLFSDTVSMYEVKNNGGWYNFGFVLGASIILGGSSGGTACRRRRRYD